MYCSNCGKEIDDKAVVCTNCGVPINSTMAAICSYKNNWLVVLLLALFLGMFGVHRFFTGHTSTAIAQLIMTVTVIFSPITAVWVFIDIIRILIGSFKSADGQELIK